MESLEQKLLETERQLAETKRLLRAANKGAERNMEALNISIKKCSDLREENENMKTELTGLKGLRDQLEVERMCLAAIGVVACADTESSRIEARKMLPEYRSASLVDVERRVDECISLRKQRDLLMELLGGISRLCDREKSGLNNEEINCRLEYLLDVLEQSVPNSKKPN